MGMKENTIKIRKNSEELREFLKRYNNNQHSDLCLSKIEQENIVAMYNIYRLELSRGNLAYILQKFEDYATTYPVLLADDRLIILRDAKEAGLII